MSDVSTSEVSAIERRIESLNSQLLQAQSVVQEWTDAAGNLAQSAAEARAKNQGMGRGIGGMLLGAKYRSAMRSAAASSNAAIAKDVAEKRARISDNKKQAQELVRALKAEISAAKTELRLAAGGSKAKASKSKASLSSVDLLHKLKEAKELGLLTDDEYEEKRKKIVSEI